MGTTIRDYFLPEFWLIGKKEINDIPATLKLFYSTINDIVPICDMTWENVEIVKMAYNCYIGFKIIYANTLMEMCHKLPYSDVDVVTNTLKKATDRIISTKYLMAGAGDGGACHPRDNLALSWLSEQMDLSADPFGFVMDARFKQNHWVAHMAIQQALETNLPIVIIGARYKINSNLTDYSSSLQIYDIIRSDIESAYDNLTVKIYDPIAGYFIDKIEAAVYVLTINDESTRNFPYPKGSVIIDLWRCLLGKKLDGVKYIPLGLGSFSIER